MYFPNENLQPLQSNIIESFIDQSNYNNEQIDYNDNNSKINQINYSSDSNNFNHNENFNYNEETNDEVLLSINSEERCNN